MDHFINGSLVTGLGEGNGREITGVWAGITEARSELWCIAVDWKELWCITVCSRWFKGELAYWDSNTD